MPRKKDDIDLATALRAISEQLAMSARQPNLHGYKPHIKQVKFHSSVAKRRLYIGGNRSGKTVGGVVEDCWWLTGRHPFRETPPPPVRGRVVSVDFLNGIAKIILPQFKQWLPPSDLKGGSWDTAYNKELRTLTLANGSSVEFMSYDQELDKFAGTSRHFVHFDEEPPEVIYTENVARLVDTGGSLWITMTPVEGMTWVYDTVYEPGKEGQNPNIDVIEVDMTENPYLNQDDVQEFLDSLSADERKARGSGQFVQMGGLIYKTFDPKPGGLHVIEQSTMEAPTPPKDWLWVVSLDHGFNNPTAILWHGISPDGRALTFHEEYGSGRVIEDWARTIHSINREFGRTPDYYIGDPSIKNTDPITGTSIHQEYIKYGIPFQLANNDVKAGLIRVARYMEPRKDGIPLWRVTSNCRNLIRELTRYRWKTYSSKKLASTNNPFDEPHKKDDHASDSLRYFIMSRPNLGDDFVGRVTDEQIYQELDDETGFHIGTPRPMVARGPKSALASRTDWEYAEVDSGTQWEYDEHLGGVW
ncbi:MAG TPA: terminase family protein [Patescibacteria group bacterium]|nr:terminase family protein [Patescibacteria group bacterium]